MALFEAIDSNIGDEVGHKVMPVSKNMAHAKLDILCRVTHDISEVEADWRSLEKNGVESPGQSFDFIKQWTESFGIPTSEQSYCVVRLEGAPIALFSLQNQNRFGVKILAPFPGTHVGCAPPLVDVARMAKLNTNQRETLWRAARDQFKGVDAVYLPYVPQVIDGETGIYDQIGTFAPADTLYRSTFESWEQCDREQRSRSRRKHDKQQGVRLEALGEVGFEELDAQSENADKVLDCMFIQRARRFKEKGIRDPFADEAQRAFYRDALKGKGALKGMLHVLRLNNEDVAVRYNLVHQDRMFCLISSMSDNPKIQAGSPGKQCLLRVMKNVFDNGIRTFDMGAGFTDEKRHWCNEQISLRHYYVPLTLKGRVVSTISRWKKTLRYHIKYDERLMKLIKSLRCSILRFQPKTKKSS